MPLETLQKLGWPGTLARRCVVVNHSLMIPVSDIRPDPSFSGMRETPVQYFHRRVVRSDHFGGQHKVFQAEVKRIEQTGALPHPPAHGLDAQVHTETTEDFRLPVQREMIGMLCHNHLGQQSRARCALLNRL